MLPWTKYLTLLIVIMVETVLWHQEVPLLLPLALNHKTEKDLMVLIDTKENWRQKITKKITAQPS